MKYEQLYKEALTKLEFELWKSCGDTPQANSKADFLFRTIVTLMVTIDLQTEAIASLKSEVVENDD